MNLNSINSLVSFVIKDLKPDLILTKPLFERLLHSAQTKQFTELLPAFETNRIISVELSPFKIIMGDNTPELTINSFGRAILPSDCYYPSSARFRYVKNGVLVGWYDIPILSDKEFEDRVASNLMKPSFQYPISNHQAAFMRFAPTNLKRAYFTYLSFPTYPVYAVIVDRGFQEYDAANSSTWQWKDASTILIIQKLLAELNLSLTVEQITNYQQQKQNQQ